MNDKISQFVDTLLQYHTPVPVKVVASSLEVTPRTIRNYIRAVNRQNNIITNTKDGLIINHEKGLKLLDQLDEMSEIPQTSVERGFYLITQLIIYKKNDLNIFDLSDQLYVSYSTLKNDIARMNKDYSRFNIYFSVKHDTLTYQGEEKDVRKLVSYVISKETKNQFSSLDILKNIFGESFIMDIYHTLYSIYDQYHITINDFSFMNTVMHLAILISRASSDQIKEDMSVAYKSDEEKKMINELIKTLEKSFHIHFNVTEQAEIALLISSNTYQHAKLSEIVHDDLYNFSAALIEDINDNFYVRLDAEGFLPLFIMHLRNLMVRCKNNSFVKNPMKETIKKISPVIYDIAVFVALRFKDYTHYSLTDDEISFIAMHIGTAIDSSTEEPDQIKTVLICPQYGDLRQQLAERIRQSFSDDLTLMHIGSSLDEINSDDEFIISVIPINVAITQPFICISPFLDDHSLALIKEKVSEIRKKQKNEWFKKSFRKYFDPDLFVYTEENICPNDVIHVLTQKMTEKKVIADNFENQVLEREEACATSFYNFAIPHAAHVSAYSTKVGVMINKNGIIWNGKTVYVVLLLAVNEYDKSIFMELYNTLISILSNQMTINEIKKIHTFNDFENVIISRT